MRNRPGERVSPGPGGRSGRVLVVSATTPAVAVVTAIDTEARGATASLPESRARIQRRIGASRPRPVLLFLRPLSIPVSGLYQTDELRVKWLIRTGWAAGTRGAFLH